MNPASDSAQRRSVINKRNNNKTQIVPFTNGESGRCEICVDSYYTCDCCIMLQNMRTTDILRYIKPLLNPNYFLNPRTKTFIPISLAQNTFL